MTDYSPYLALLFLAAGLFHILTPDQYFSLWREAQ